MPSRESELYKDKIEVSLDSRQIFYMFFGGAVIVGMVFVLGVMVGRRVEARGHLDRAQTQTAADPLAALDRLESGSGLSFQGALTGSDAPSEVEKTIAEIEKAHAQPGAAAPTAVGAAPAVAPVAAVVAPADADEPKADKPVKADKSEKSEHGDKAEHDKSDKTDKKSKSAKGDKGEHGEKPEKDASAEPTSKDAKSKFTLQLSSFQDKGEAQAYLDGIKSAGYEAYLTSAEVDGKGTFYRVRVGSYRSLEAANDAKATFEKSQKKSAYVTRL